MEEWCSMGIAAGVGESRLKSEPFKAGKEAAEEALSQMSTGRPDLVLVFSTEGFDQHELLRGIRSVTGKIPLIGCCGAGVITEQGLSTDSIAVMALKSDTLSISRGIGRDISSDAMCAGEESAEGLLDKLKGSKRSYYVVMMLPDGLTGNVSDVVEGAYRVLGAGCRFVGGGAGDNLKFIKTYQFLDGQVYQDAVVSALFVSNEPMGVGVRHGWTPVGKPMIVTKARGNVVMELDGKPAFEAYCEHFGIEEGLSIENFSRFAMEHPLGMPDGRGSTSLGIPCKPWRTAPLFALLRCLRTLWSG